MRFLRLQHGRSVRFWDQMLWGDKQCSGGLAVIHPSKGLWVFMSGLLLDQLAGSCLVVHLTRGSQLLGGWGSYNATLSSIVAHFSGIGIDDDGFVVNIDDVDIRHIVDGAIVEKGSIVPIAALVAQARITETINNAAIETYMRAPITGVVDV